MKQSTGDPSADTITEALALCKIELPAEQVVLLDQYCRELWSWNEKLNLTRHTNYTKFVSRDVVDSLQLATLLDNGEEVLELGSGGGVPGVLLSILRPDLQMSLSESVGKKAVALEAIVRSLELPTPVHHCRGEDLLEDFRYHAVVARAVGPLWKILKWVEPHWSSLGRMLLIKGPRWVDERAEARHRGLLQNVQMRRCLTYSTPGTEAENTVLKLWPSGLAEP